jgi:hypothetical protein
MRWFLDTEFDENGTTIKLISIALVSARGEEYYRVLSDGWRPEDCNTWVQENVLTRLPPQQSGKWASRQQVASDIQFLLLKGGAVPEIWGYFADYDWVVLCQLFGRMVDLPKGFPMYCRDLKQEMSRRNLSRDLFPKNEGAHDALEDARWIRNAYVAMGRMA